jgi:hypothetical protein
MHARCLVVSALFVGCGTNSLDPGEPLGGSRTIHGTVVDFQTGAAVTGASNVSASGLLPAPRVTSQGASFTIEGIPDNSVFQILASAPPTHRATFGESVTVIDADLDGVKTAVVSEAYLGTLATAFGVTPTAAKGILFVRLVDANGMPRSGIAASNLVLAGGASGPFLLDANLMPAKTATTTSASGWAVFFEVPAGVVTLGQAAAPTVTLEMAASPTAAGSVTLADAKTTDGAPKLPTNVSLSQQVAPIFPARGCTACHSGNGIGKDLGGLDLQGGADKIYKELVLETTTRVNLTKPEASLVLTMPSRETPPDNHPNVTFASNQDPDYLKILVWIREGAKNN